MVAVPVMQQIFPRQMVTLGPCTVTSAISTRNNSGMPAQRQVDNPDHRCGVRSILFD